MSPGTNVRDAVSTLAITSKILSSNSAVLSTQVSLENLVDAADVVAEAVFGNCSCVSESSDDTEQQTLRGIGSRDKVTSMSMNGSSVMPEEEPLVHLGSFGRRSEAKLIIFVVGFLQVSQDGCAFNHRDRVTEFIVNDRRDLACVRVNGLVLTRARHSLCERQDVPAGLITRNQSFFCSSVSRSNRCAWKGVL